MVIGLNLMYNFNWFRLNPNLSRSKKLLHVFWNTLYAVHLVIIYTLIADMYWAKSRKYLRCSKRKVRKKYKFGKKIGLNK